MYQIYVDNALFCDSRVDDLAIINPKIKLEVNKAGSMTFIIPPTHPYYDAITKRMSIIRVVRDDLELFEGICTSVSDDFYKQRTIECEGTMSFFNDTMQRPHKYQNMTIRGLLEAFVANHNSLCEDNKHFTVGMVTVGESYNALYCYSNYESTMECLKNDLVDDFGGYLRVRTSEGVRYIDYLADSPNTASQSIALGENLVDFESTLDTTKIATVVIPLGATKETTSISGLDERVGIASVNDGKDYVYSADAVESFGWIEKVVTWDDVTTPAALKSKAQAYLSDTQFENMVIEAKAIDLHLAESSIEPFKIMDKIQVISQPHGLNKYFLLTKQTINLNKPESDTITLGSEEKVSLTAQNRETDKSILKRVEDISVSSILDSASKNASQLITNAGNGYITLSYDEDGHPYELLIMDKPTKEEATKVWRWNIAGLGYSDQGYDAEEYGLAMTMDGQIVADYITTGTLSADRIKGGTLTLGGVSESNGTIDVYDAWNRLTARWIGGGVTYYNVGWGSEYGEVRMNVDGSGVNLWDYITKKNLGVIKANRYTRADGSKYCDASMAVYASDNDKCIEMHSDVLYVLNGSEIHFGTKSGSSYSIKHYVTSSGNAVFNNLSTTGEKHRIVDTDDYGVRKLYSYEMASPMFGDMGEAKTNSKGICTISIEDIFSETIDIKDGYQVFLQPYGEGSVYVAERTDKSFTVKGTPGLAFGWELKAAQKDYAHMRLEAYEEENNG